MTREEAIKTLEGMGEFKHVCDKDNEFEAIRFAIKALKERPHGEWVKKYNTDDPTTVCSVCGFDTEDQVYFNFCPNCGADMQPRILDEAIDGEGKDGNVKESEPKDTHAEYWNSIGEWKEGEET